MASMKKLWKTIAAVLLACIVLVAGGLILAQNGLENPVSKVADQATANAANAALDAIGIKERADELLRGNAGRISSATGIPEAAVQNMIDELDVQSWQVAPLPEGAVAQETANIAYDGIDATITAYDDPSIITVETNMGTVTLAVPESAQAILASATRLS